MSFKEKIKENNTIRKIGKRLNIYKDFIGDAHDFSSNYLESALNDGDYRYNILLHVHSLEKGMCMQKLRPFGAKKVKELICMLKTYNNHDDFEYHMGISSLFSWKEIYDKHGWQNEAEYEEVKAFLEVVEKQKYAVGNKAYSVERLNETEKEIFKKIILTRHSVRDFKAEELKDDDINFAVDCFIEAPTACNRQMCKIHMICKPELVTMLNDIIIGVSGFNTNTINYFVITYDLAAFAYSGERQQGLFNAGLCTMNFINGLHSRGIGSCCLQWSNKRSDDNAVRTALKLKKSERIAVVVAAGYYLAKNTIPCSIRREKTNVLNVIK